MRIFKNREFNKWAAREGLADSDLRNVVVEKAYANALLVHNYEELNQAMKAGALIEVANDE